MSIGTNFFGDKKGDVRVALQDENGDAILIKCDAGDMPTGAGYAKGCIAIATDTGSVYSNSGTTSSASFTQDSVGTDTIGSDELKEEGVEIDNMKTQKVVYQGDAVLDLTDDSTPASVTLASSGDISASRGGDNFIVTKVYAYVTTTVAADNTAPVVTIQGSTTGAATTVTIADATADGDVIIDEVSSADSLTAIDLTSEDLEAEVTTAAADAATAAGECKIIVEGILIK